MASPFLARAKPAAEVVALFLRSPTWRMAYSLSSTLPSFAFLDQSRQQSSTHFEQSEPGLRGTAAKEGCRGSKKQAFDDRRMRHAVVVSPLIHRHIWYYD